MFNVGYHNISKLLKTKNIETKGFRNKYPVNESFFHNINSPIKAYWLGVLYADGSLTGKNEIRLGMKDKEHVEKYKKAIGAINHKIGKTIDKRWEKECYDFHLGIKSSTMFEDLCQWGCVPNKTYKLRVFLKSHKTYYLILLGDILTVMEASIKLVPNGE